MDIPVESLKSRYREPWRRYHTLQHIGELLELLKANAAGLESPRAVELAIWYHDAVYDPLAAKGDNERASDALFAADWHACGGEPDDPLRRLDNVVLTPHLGYVTAQNYRRFYEDMVADIAGWLKGEPVRRLV